MLSGIFQTPQSFTIDDVSCHSGDEKIAQPAIENNFRRDTRIGTAYKRGERGLSAGEFFAPSSVLVGVTQVAFDKSAVARD